MIDAAAAGRWALEGNVLESENPPEKIGPRRRSRGKETAGAKSACHRAGGRPFTCAGCLTVRGSTTPGNRHFLKRRLRRRCCLTRRTLAESPLVASVGAGSRVAALGQARHLCHHP